MKFLRIKRDEDGGKNPRRQEKAITWRRSVKAEQNDLSWTNWNEVRQEVKDHNEWKLLLCSPTLHSQE